MAVDLPTLQSARARSKRALTLRVGSVVFLSSGPEFALVQVAGVRAFQASAPVAAVSDHGGSADGAFAPDSSRAL